MVWGVFATFGEFDKISKKQTITSEMTFYQEDKI